MVLQHSSATLPPEALFVLRFQKAHSFQKGAYSELMDAQDRAFLPWLASFQVREPPPIPQLLYVYIIAYTCVIDCALLRFMHKLCKQSRSAKVSEVYRHSL